MSELKSSCCKANVTEWPRKDMMGKKLESVYNCRKCGKPCEAIPSEPGQGVRGHSADARVASVKELDLPPESSAREIDRKKIKDKSFIWTKSKTGNIRIISNIGAIDAFEIVCHLSAAYMLTGTDGKMLIPKKPEARG